MRDKNIQCTFHYLPLHQSIMYKKSFPNHKNVVLPKTEDLSNRIVRLPLFLGIEDFSRLHYR